MTNDNLQQFLARSKELHDAVEGILTHIEPDYVREEADIRSDFKLDLKKLYNGVKNQIMELEKVTRRIGEELSCQSLDIRKLESRKITIYYDRKRANV